AVHGAGAGGGAAVARAGRPGVHGRRRTGVRRPRLERGGDRRRLGAGGRLAESDGTRRGARQLRERARRDGEPDQLAGQAVVPRGGSAAGEVTAPGASGPDFQSGLPWPDWKSGPLAPGRGPGWRPRDWPRTGVGHISTATLAEAGATEK